MGGIGSGNWERSDRKTTTEESKEIDIRILHRTGQLSPGCHGTYSWNSNGKPAGTIGFRVEKGRIVMGYRYRRPGGEWVDVELPVLLADTSCNYGGSRPWFICPTSGCGRRAAVLYNVGMYFECRHCGDLSYSSQQENICWRMERKRRKLIMRLGGSPHNDPYPKKPKHLHWKTYNRLIDEAEYYEDVSWKLVEQYLVCRR